MKTEPYISSLAFLFWDKDDSECQQAKALVIESKIPCCYIPCIGIAEPDLCYLGKRWYGLEHITRGLASIREDADWLEK